MPTHDEYTVSRWVHPDGTRGAAIDHPDGTVRYHVTLTAPGDDTRRIRTLEIVPLTVDSDNTVFTRRPPVATLASLALVPWIEPVQGPWSGAAKARARAEARWHGGKCTVEGCDRRHQARGYCDRHYQQWYKRSRQVEGGES